MPLVAEISSPARTRHIQRCSLVLLYFVYLYSLAFVFVPFGTSTRVMLGGAGFFVACWRVFKNYKRSGRITMPLKFGWVLFWLILLAAVSLLSIAINSTSDTQFISYPVSIGLILLGGFFVAQTTYKVWGVINFRIVSSYIIWAVILQVCIALLMFVIPAFRTVMLGLLRTIDIDTVSHFFEFRIIGFGSEFFGSGVVNSFALILIVSLLRQPNTRIFLLITAYILVFFIGMMMARTTLVGAGLSLLYLAYDSRFWVLKITNLFVRIFRSFLILTLVSWGVIFTLSEDARDKMSDGMDYGFELFVNYFDSGSMSSASTDELKDFYSIRPQTAKSWIIGDGYYANPSNPSSYYMNTDVGYMRLVFYFGLIGLFVYLTLQLCILYCAHLGSNGDYRSVFVVSAVLFLVVMSKGFFDMSPLVAVFCFMNNRQSHTIKK